jgi:glycosyltransferase involved in cell wall biosynthesis
MAEPLITIAITCYKEGDWLLECWDSVLTQSDDRWIALLVMDGTTHQRTREVFQRLEHPRLRKYEMPANMGPHPTRDKAFQLTETPYHFTLDADDQLYPDSVRLVLDTFARHPGAGFVYGDYQCFGALDVTWRFPHEYTADELVESQCSPGACAYQVSAWRRLGGYAAELAKGNADYDFMIGASEAGIEGRHCGATFYRYRLGPGQVSGTYGLRYHETHEIIVRRHPLFFQDPRRRDRFLALGYKKAALAHYAAGNVARARELAATARRYGLGWDVELFGARLEQTLPPWAYRGLLGVYRAGRRAHGVLRGR